MQSLDPDPLRQNLPFNQRANESCERESLGSAGLQCASPKDGVCTISPSLSEAGDEGD